MEERQALLFVNKKKQKNFFYAGACRWDRRGQTATNQINKNFLVLFFKKELVS
jgi:hypothetical protein